MSELEKAKTERTTAKREVTKSVTNLESGLALFMDDVTLQGMSKEIDDRYLTFVGTCSAYRDLCISENADESYKVVNCMDLDAYELDVKTQFVGARDAYRRYMYMPPPPPPPKQGDKDVHLKKENPQHSLV